MVKGSKLCLDDFMSLAPESRERHEVWRIASLLCSGFVQCMKCTRVKKCKIM